MRLPIHPRLRLAAAATALVAGLVAVTFAALPAEAESPPKSHRQCVHLHLKEEFIRFDTNGPSSIQVPPGFQADWFDRLTDWETGTKERGTAVGSMDIMYDDPKTGHNIEYQFEMFHFPEGTFYVASAFDRMKVINSEWISQPITGTSGKYRGWTGVWTWRTVPQEDPSAPPPFEDLFDLCGPAA
jgi:hypothetical protein